MVRQTQEFNFSIDKTGDNSLLHKINYTLENMCSMGHQACTVYVYDLNDTGASAVFNVATNKNFHSEVRTSNVRGQDGEGVSLIFKDGFFHLKQTANVAGEGSYNYKVIFM
jgi:hypothetical protein